MMCGMKQLAIRVTDQENELIEAAADQEGLSKNAWLRKQVGLPLPDKPGFKPGADNPKSGQATSREPQPHDRRESVKNPEKKSVESSGPRLADTWAR